MIWAVGANSRGMDRFGSDFVSGRCVGLRGVVATRATRAA